MELLQSRGDFAMEVLKDVVFNPPDDVQKVEPDESDGWGGFGVASKKDKKKKRSAGLE